VTTLQSGGVPSQLSGSDVEPELFRRVFAGHASGVAVVTAAGRHPVGFTATSVVSVSAEPPLLSFNVSLTSSSWPTLAAATHFGVHLLAADQSAIAVRFALTGADRFGAQTTWHPGPFGVPVLADVVAWLICEVQSRVLAGDHAVVIGQVVRADHVDDVAPLVYHHGRFTHLLV
jgi:flavin reductase (DIM6/NTAB) family NADH-FMN oxidoreductase RutF